MSIFPAVLNKLKILVYSFKDELPFLYENFVDVIDPWLGNPLEVTFDPEHPENERELFSRLIDRFGSQVAHCIETQADIAATLDTKEAASFTAQRADFLISFPNGSRLILEPGDHDDAAQINLDKRRDAAFKKIGVDTLRFRNCEIADSGLAERRRKKECRIAEATAHSQELTVDKLITEYIEKHAEPSKRSWKV